MKAGLRFLAFALGVGLALAAPTAVRAQVGYGGAVGPPAWGPPVSQGTQYYYIPEIDGYYDLYNGLYIVFDGQQWVGLPYLNGYDPHYFHPVPVVSYAGPQPWLYINSYRRYYPQYVVGYRRGGWGGGGSYYGRSYGYGAGQPYGQYRGGNGNRGYGRGNYYGQGGYDQRNYGGNYNQGGYGGNNNQGNYNRDQRAGYGSRSQREGGQPDPNQSQPSQSSPTPNQPGGQPTYGQRQPSQPNFGDQNNDRQPGTDRDQRAESPNNASNPNWGGRGRR